MELQCKIAVKAARETIWPYYADPGKRSVWEEDLEYLVFNGEAKTGTTGKMKLQNMPEMAFTLTEVAQDAAWCERTDVPGKGSLFFDHTISQKNGKTYIRHSVRLDKETLTDEDLGFLGAVFADVPAAMLKIKREVEK